MNGKTEARFLTHEIGLEPDKGLATIPATASHVPVAQLDRALVS